MMLLSHVANAVNGELNGADVPLSGVSINTRIDCQQRLFIALKGDNFDAHDFIAQAEEAGANALLVEHEVDSSLPTVIVTDTHQALMTLAAWWRSQYVGPVVGVTGSVGKTTVKEMLNAIFQQIGDGIATHGNLNNEIGAPLTVLRLTPEDCYAIIEMGMNHAGEIARITAMANPTIALVNNAAAAHLEGLGSLQAVAQAKGEIFSGLVTDGIAVINRDDVFYEQWLELADGHRVVTFGLNEQADVSATYKVKKDTLRLSVVAFNKSFKVTLKALGEHSVRNALAAIAVAIAANIPHSKIAAGLATYRAVSGRLNQHNIGDNILIDDTYNANPASMLAAISVLEAHPNNTLIVGDMAELGSAAHAEHSRLGEMAAQHGIQRVFACGQYAELVIDGFNRQTELQATESTTTESMAFLKQKALIAYLQQSEVQKQGPQTILVKGSRSAKMERVVSALTELLEEASSPLIRERAPSC